MVAEVVRDIGVTENTRQKNLVVDLSLDKEILKEALERN